MPRLRNARSSAFDDASSSAATSRGSASTMVTSAPKLRHTLANSQPITPPPSTIDRRRDPVEPQRVLGGDDPLAVDVEAGQAAGVGAGGEHDVRRRCRPCRRPSTCVRAGEPALALDHGDPAGLDQPGEALEEPGDDAVLVGVHAGHVDAVEAGPHAELLGLAGLVGDLGGVQQRLGGDAADVQAGAAEVALLDEADRQAELSGAQGAGVAARTRPENEYVEVGRRPLSSLREIPAEIGVSPILALPLVSASTGHLLVRLGSIGPMGFLDRFRRGSRTKMSGPAARWHRAPGRPGCARPTRSTSSTCSEFVTARRGVEGFVEPRTAVSEVTLLLVAHDGEWTRRRVPSVTGRTTSATSTRCRRTTPRSSASRSGCATTTAARSQGQLGVDPAQSSRRVER